MSTRSSNPFVSVYRSRIGDPSTGDEVYGYWLFVLGAVLGVVGMVLFVVSAAASLVREVGIVLLALALILLLAGPIVRLPLRRTALFFAALGGLVCLVATGWFVLAFPENWFVAGGQSRLIIELYSVGLAILGIGGIVVPMVTGPADRQARAEAESASAREERDQLAAEVQEKDRRIADLEERTAAGERDGEDLESVRAELRSTQDRLSATRASEARFEMYEDRGGKYRWRLRHDNGNVLATSGQSYTAKRKTQQRIQGVRRHALGAGLLKISPDDADPTAMAEDDDPIPEESQATFEVYEDRGGEYRWRLVHDNGNVLGDSGEGYTAERDARRAIESVRTAAEEGVYLRAEPTAFELYRDAGGEFRWRLVHRNGNVLADSGEGYASRSGARDGIESVRENVDGDRAEFEVYEDRGGEFRWRLVHDNGNLIADGGQGYDDESEARNAVDRVREYAPDAHALDIGRAAFEIFEDAAGEHRWRLRHRNGNVLGDGGQGYASRSGAMDAVDGVKRNVAGADVVVE